jgi:hypothetical protein
MDRVKRARHDTLIKKLTAHATEQAAASRARAKGYKALVEVLAGEGGEEKRRASEAAVSAIAKRAAARVTRGAAKPAPAAPAAAAPEPAAAPPPAAQFAST